MEVRSGDLLCKQPHRQEEVVEMHQDHVPVADFRGHSRERLAEEAAVSCHAPRLVRYGGCVRSAIGTSVRSSSKLGSVGLRIHRDLVRHNDALPVHG